MNIHIDYSGVTRKHIGGVKHFLTTVCPINHNAVVIMTENSFRRMCKIHSKSKISKSKLLISSKDENDICCCSECEIRIKVQTGKKFTPPKGVIFKKLDEFKN